MSKWYNPTVECRSCGTSTADVLQSVNPIQKENDSILANFKAIDLVFKDGRYYQIREVYGNDNKIAFKVFNQRAVDAMKVANNGKYQETSVYTANLRNLRKAKMDTAFKMRIQYYANLKRISNLWAERVIDEADMNVEGKCCSHCGSMDVKVYDSFKIVYKHLGFTKADIAKENRTEKFVDNFSHGAYLEDGYDYLEDSALNASIKEEMAEFKDFNDSIEMEKVEDQFFDLVANYHINIVQRKLGTVKCALIADVIADYLQAVM